MIFTMEAKDENLDELNEKIASLISEKCTVKVLNEIYLAVEEIFVNICHYAYAPKIGSVEIFMDLEECNGSQIFKISFTDEGKQFNPLERADPDITLAAEERQIGGLGIFLTKKYMDEVKYDYKDKKNIFYFCKNLGNL